MNGDLVQLPTTQTKRSSSKLDYGSPVLRPLTCVDPIHGTVQLVTSMCSKTKTINFKTQVPDLVTLAFRWTFEWLTCCRASRYSYVVKQWTFGIETIKTSQSPGQEAVFRPRHPGSTRPHTIVIQGSVVDLLRGYEY